MSEGRTGEPEVPAFPRPAAKILAGGPGPPLAYACR